MIFILFVAILFVFLHLYIKIATRYNITDKPNTRSSHDSVTIRGGGIVFPISMCIYSLITGFQFPYFLLGLVLISCVSFWDDMRTISNLIRIIVHLIAVFLLFFQSGIFNYPIWILLTTLILVIGIINAYNFMDGINGITVLYTFAIFTSLYLINQYVIIFIPIGYFVPLFASLSVFGFFNVRKKAKTFAGDVGSVSIAFIISYLILILVLKTQCLVWILLLSLYGVDTVITIFFRLLRKENIFEAHRSHFFQFLANEKKILHISVSAAYALIQLVVNLIIIYSYQHQNNYIPIIMLVAIVIGYLILRIKYEGFNRLIKKY